MGLVAPARALASTDLERHCVEAAGTTNRIIPCSSFMNSRNPHYGPGPAGTDREQRSLLGLLCARPRSAHCAWVCSLVPSSGAGNECTAAGCALPAEWISGPQAE